MLPCTRPLSRRPECWPTGQPAETLDTRTVNEAHKGCGGDEWRSLMRSIVPSAIGDLDLGNDVLEVGPGYGAATDVVSELVPQLTAVEIDEELVAYLTDRFASHAHVDIQRGDGTALEFEDGRFTG